jgi:hypothetical protein
MFLTKAPNETRYHWAERAQNERKQTGRNRAEPQCYQGLNEPENCVTLKKNPPITPFTKMHFAFSRFALSSQSRDENRAVKMPARTLKSTAHHLPQKRLFVKRPHIPCRGAAQFNKSPEPTAVGAGSSAVAVHAASRRWLSFLR